ncbi:hypothetical protein, partial [Pseudomonas sp.]|uniref:hypothetical protein n=1 Tax=Pseudomonas sp. TaxID=306 RepID=UPI0032DAD695
ELLISSDTHTRAAITGISHTGEAPNRLFPVIEAPIVDAETEPERSDIFSSEAPTRSHADG